MKYGMIWKSTLREIRSSFGRFAAIMAIVALGVGLFAGLKVTRRAMSNIVQDYWEETDFYDYRLLSDYGFEQEDVDFLRSVSDVAAVEGALGFDALYLDAEGGEGAARFYSLTENVNKVVVLEGQMPENPDECLVDAKLFGSDMIGKKLTLSGGNTQETLEHFAKREYLVVGRAQSSLYIQFERGNTSLGTGKIDGFVYLPKEGFDEDYYTELYVKFHENMALYSDAYKEFLKQKDILWEDLTTQAAGKRFGRLQADAEAEYADALEEYECEKADAQAELNDAKRKLEEAGNDIEDAQKEITDAKTELADGERELADAKKTLADKEQELADGERELADAHLEWEKQESRVDAAWETLFEEEEKLKEQEALLMQKKSELSEGERGLWAALEVLKTESAKPEMSGVFPTPIKDTQDVYAAKKGLQTTLAGLQNILTVSGSDAAVAATVGPQILALQKTIADLEVFLRTYEQIEEAKAAILEKEALLQAGKEQIAAAYSQLSDADDELAKAWTEMEDAARKIEDGRTSIDDAQKEVRDGERRLADARQELADGEKKLADARVEYADGLAEYEDGVAEYETKTAEAQDKLADAREEIDSMEPPKTYVLGRDTNVGYVCFESDSAIVDGIANVFPVFFFLVAALVCITTMNRMVEEQRTQIGVLKALGYGEAAVMMKYVFYSGSAAFAGCVLGFFGGTYVFPKVIWAAYCMMYSVGEMRYVFDWKLALVSVLVSLLCSVGTTWFSCRMELFQMAAQLMRPKAPKAGKRVFLEKIGFLWKRLSFLRKVSVRNIFRYKKRLFMMVLGISGCTALLVTGFGINDSIAGVADQQFREIQIYNLEVTLAQGLDSKIQKELVEAMGQGTGESLVSEWTRLSERSMELVTEGSRKSVYVVMFEEGTPVTDFLDLHTAKNEKIAYPAVGEAVLTRKLAQELGIHVGDLVTLENDDLREIPVVVSGISENYIYHYVYLDAATYAKFMGEEPEYKSLYVNVAEGAKEHELAAALMGVDKVANVTINTDVMSRIDRMMQSMNLIVIVVVICAALLAFVVLYNLTNINITERLREIATIKVLGFYRQETASYVFRENTLLTLFGVLPGLFLGKCLHSFVMSQIKVDMIAFDVRILPKSYLYSLLFTFLFSKFVNRIMSGKLEKISMTESLKSVD